MSEPLIIDVREADEFDAERVPHSVNVPLSRFTSTAPGLLAHMREGEILFMCQSGARAQQALEMVKGLGCGGTHAFRAFGGGLVRWKKEGRPVAVEQKVPLTIMRQVQLTAGTCIATFALLGAFVHPAFAILAALGGGGILLAGATGNCALATLMVKAPWNRNYDLKTALPATAPEHS